MFTKFIQIGNTPPPSFTQLILMSLCLMKRTLVTAAMRPGVWVSFQLLSSCKNWEMSPSDTEPWFLSSKMSTVISVLLPSYESCDIHKCLYTSKHCLTTRYFKTQICYMAYYGFSNLCIRFSSPYHEYLKFWTQELFFSDFYKHLGENVRNSNIRNLAMNWRVRVAQLFLLGGQKMIKQKTACPGRRWLWISSSYHPYLISGNQPRRQPLVPYSSKQNPWPKYPHYVEFIRNAK